MLMVKKLLLIRCKITYMIYCEMARLMATQKNCYYFYYNVLTNFTVVFNKTFQQLLVCALLVVVVFFRNSLFNIFVTKSFRDIMMDWKCFFKQRIF